MRGHLNARDDFEAGWRGLERFVDASDHVMIGDRDGSQTALRGFAYNFRRRQSAVGVRRMHVQINEALSHQQSAIGNRLASAERPADG